MIILLDSVDGESIDYDGKVTTCIRANGRINILFETTEEGLPVHGRLSLKETHREDL